MDILQDKLKSVIINFENLACLQIKGSDTVNFQDTIRKIFAGYRTAVIHGLVKDELKEIKYEIVRNPINEDDITNK